MAVTYVVDPVKLQTCLMTAYQQAKIEIPIVTGNLRNVSKKIRRVGAMDFKVFFDVKIAPYAEWVNNYSPKSAGWLLAFQKQFKEDIEQELRKVGYIV